jgi:hypothetical protein
MPGSSAWGSGKRSSEGLLPFPGLSSQSLTHRFRPVRFLLAAGTRDTWFQQMCGARCGFAHGVLAVIQVVLDR